MHGNSFNGKDRRFRLGKFSLDFCQILLLTARTDPKDHCGDLHGAAKKGYNTDDGRGYEQKNFFDELPNSFTE